MSARLLLLTMQVTPLQLATVYSTMAAGGVYHKPHLISRVEKHDGQVLEEVKVCFLTIFLGCISLGCI